MHGGNVIDRYFTPRTQFRLVGDFQRSSSKSFRKGIVFTFRLIIHVICCPMFLLMFFSCLPRGQFVFLPLGFTVTRSQILFLPWVEVSRFLPFEDTHWVNSVSTPGACWKQLRVMVSFAHHLLVCNCVVHVCCYHIHNHIISSSSMSLFTTSKYMISVPCVG